MAARALFAFHVGQTELVDDIPEPTAEALLGALLHAENQAVQIRFSENFAEFAMAWAKSIKARSKRRR